MFNHCVYNDATLQNISTSDSCSDEVWAEAQPWTFLALKYAMLGIMADSRALNSQSAGWVRLNERGKSESGKWEQVYQWSSYKVRRGELL